MIRRSGLAWRETFNTSEALNSKAKQTSAAAFPPVIVALTGLIDAEIEWWERRPRRTVTFFFIAADQRNGNVRGGITGQ